jgi:hypothetical protein
MEMGSGGFGAVLAAVSYADPQWIEQVFRLEPDNGGGEAEWLVAALFLLVALASFALAGLEWRRNQSIVAAQSPRSSGTA